MRLLYSLPERKVYNGEEVRYGNTPKPEFIPDANYNRKQIGKDLSDMPRPERLLQLYVR